LFIRGQSFFSLFFRKILPKSHFLKYLSRLMT
jgi:hypothetical protein